MSARFNLERLLFLGRLLSVNERNVQRIADLFDINERILVAGEWKYGFFSMTAVGAFHVGEIELDFDVSHFLSLEEPLRSSSIGF